MVYEFRGEGPTPRYDMGAIKIILNFPNQIFSFSYSDFRIPNVSIIRETEKNSKPNPRFNCLLAYFRNGIKK